MTLRCGDHVRHEPTGEEWLVAYADPETGHMAPAGWPECRALIADCTLIRACDEEEHRTHVGAWMLLARHDDHRFQAVKRLYAGRVP